jgi:hypothetical protein
MPELSQPASLRRRSPAYPMFALGEALEHLEALDVHFAGNAIRSQEVGDAWGIKAKTYASRMTAALRYFGLVKYRGGWKLKNRQIVISHEGRTYLAAQQEDIRREVIRAAALRPKTLAQCWSKWGEDRPADAVCLDDLVLNSGFSRAGAREFLKIYTATITLARLGKPDSARVQEELEAPKRENSSEQPEVPRDRQTSDKVRSERELTAGILSNNATFRVMVSGPVGAREIERLIAKLRFDQQILAERSGYYVSGREDSSELLRSSVA